MDAERIKKAFDTLAEFATVIDAKSREFVQSKIEVPDFINSVLTAVVKLNEDIVEV